MKATFVALGAPIPAIIARSVHRRGVDRHRSADAWTLGYNGSVTDIAAPTPDRRRSLPIRRAGPWAVAAAGLALATLVTPSAVPADWTTYHADRSRTGAVVGVPVPHALRTTWARRLDGSVYGQPLAVGRLLLVATEADSVYALDRVTGAVRWHRSLGRPMTASQLPCGNISPLGITGTPAYDPATGSVFVVAETTGGYHTLVALAARSGTVRWRRNLDVVAGRDRRAEQQRGALAIGNGRVYVPFGGLYGDCGNYVGYVTATPTSGRGTTTHYAVPTRREGGIWAASGVAIGADGSVWVAVGNGAATGGRYDGSDSVLRLTATLSRLLGFFAPSSWGAQNAADADLGTTGPVLVGTGRVLVSGKDGRVYLLDAAHLGGVGHPLASLSGCAGFGGLAYDAVRRVAFVPCTSGLMAVAVGSRSLRRLWQLPRSLHGSPVVGGGAAWTVEDGVLVASSETSGRTLARVRVGAATRFASPVLVGSTAYVGTTTGVTAVHIS